MVGRWLDIYADGRVFEMEGSKPLRVFNTDGDVKKLLNALQQTDAGRYAIAPPGKVPPTLETERRVIRITRTNRTDSKGLVVLNVALLQGNKAVDQIPAISGQPGQQAFRTVTQSRAGSMEPLPEAYWLVGAVEWASGIRNDYSKNWADDANGLGPVWVGMRCNSPTERTAIGFHLDNNAATSPGTNGCVGILSLADLKKFVGWFNDPRYAPKVAIVNWGLGTVETLKK
jgi:lysozyme